MSMSLVALGLLLLADCATAFKGLNTLWSLPLSLGPGRVSQLQAFAGDDSFVYAGAPEGFVFAVNATNGSVKWAAGFANSVASILLYPSIPEVVYVATLMEAYCCVPHLHALRRSDGAVVGEMKNVQLFPLDGHSPLAYELAVAASGRSLVVRHGTGFCVTDEFLAVKWCRIDGDAIHVGANAHLVAVTYIGNPSNSNMVSFDTRTGDVVCNISNMSITLQRQLGLRFAITPRNLTLGSLVTPNDSKPWLWRLVDLGKCTVMRTFGINTAAIGDYARLSLLNPGRDDELIVSFNATNSTTLEAAASPVSDRKMDGYLWTQTIETDNAFGTPLGCPVPFDAGTIALWSNLTLMAVDAKTGSTRWTFPTSISVAPSLQGVFVFPLPAQRLLVPTYAGYAIFNVPKQGMELHVQESAVFESAAILPMMNATSGEPFVVFIHPSGVLVAVN